jgi:predicted O-linked N-acetylglucosamine transferase (SPINDLY family)
MGIQNCIAKTPKEYVEIAIQLATDRTYRNKIQKEILSKNAILYENPEAVRELEAFFLQALEKNAPSPFNAPLMTY